MPDRKSRSASRVRRAQEIEDSQKAMRTSIAETQRLMDKSDEMVARHRREQEDEDADSQR